jgi:3-isopropylmalate/(R)-2-methylmalate dehydratase large subunit
MTIVCGDSQRPPWRVRGRCGTYRHSEVEHVLATQTLIQRKARTCALSWTAKLPAGSHGKGRNPGIIGEIGTAGGTGSVIEYAGELSGAVHGRRMTVCNMSIEGGARAGMIAPDETTFAYVQGSRGPRRRCLGHGAALLGNAAQRRGRAFRPGSAARRRKPAAHRHLGLVAGDVVAVTGAVP